MGVSYSHRDLPSKIKLRGQAGTGPFILSMSQGCLDGLNPSLCLPSRSFWELKGLLEGQGEHRGIKDSLHKGVAWERSPKGRVGAREILQEGCLVLRHRGRRQGRA